MKVMLTGATGYIGGWTIPAMISAGHEVAALIRRPEQAEELTALAAARGADTRHLNFVIGDLAKPGLALTDDVDVDVIAHLGASFAWNLDPVVANATNVNGSVEVVRLAARIRARLVLVGGYMLTNHIHLSEIGVDLSDPDSVDWRRVATRTGVYEASKLESYARSVAVANELAVSWQAVHPATLAGHSHTGDLSEGQPLADLIATVQAGRMTAIPGSRAHWLPLVTVDHLAAILTAAVSEDVNGRELLALDDQTPSLGDLINLIAEHSGRSAVRRHVPMGALRLAAATPGLRRLVPANRESLGFLRTDRFDVSATRAFEHHHALVEPNLRTSIIASTHRGFPPAKVAGATV